MRRAQYIGRREERAAFNAVAGRIMRAGGGFLAAYFLARPKKL